jgi:hypothetical protein
MSNSSIIYLKFGAARGNRTLSLSLENSLATIALDANPWSVILFNVKVRNTLYGRIVFIRLAAHFSAVDIIKLFLLISWIARINLVDKNHMQMLLNEFSLLNI